MKNETEIEKKLITYEEICEEAFKPTIDLMMKKYDVLSMTNDQIGDAFQEVRDAVKKESEEFQEAYSRVIKNLVRRYTNKGIFDTDTHPDVIKEKEEELEEQRFRNFKKRFREQYGE